MANDQLMLQQLFGGWPLWGVERGTQTGESAATARGGGGSHVSVSTEAFLQNWALC